MDILTLLLLTIPIGLLGALTGLGGGSVLVPVLVVLGVPVKYAIASSMICIIATSSGSGASSLRLGMANIKAAMYLAIFTVIGAIVGATIASYVDQRVLYLAFAGFLSTSFLNLRRNLRGLPSEIRQDSLSKRLELDGVYYDSALCKNVSYALTKPLLGGAGMFIAGLAAGMLGIGAGAFKMSVQENVLRMPFKVSSATSNFIIGMTALAGASVYFASGLLYVGLAAPMVIGTSLGALAGGRILGRFQKSTLKLIFLIIVTYLIAQMVYREVTAF